MMSMTSNDLSYEMIAMIISHNDVNILNDQYVHLYLALSLNLKQNLGREWSTFGLKANKSSFNSNSISVFFLLSDYAS